MKNLIYVALIALMALSFNGCGSEILIAEQTIQPAKEWDATGLRSADSSIFKKYFKRAYIFSGSY